ncbi:MAG: OmpA family protein [Bryobacteraceae bacterium]
MPREFLAITTLVLSCTIGLSGQETPERPKSAPLYRVTVIDRTVSAVNYQYRNGPTQIDFRGTVLLPDAKGQATVESKSGRTEIQSRFEHLAPPTRYGREYLTYVLWAITPEGHAKNLGEILAGSSDKAKLHVTTDLQTFGLIVTAEPYSAARQPSDVVVMENQIRPDTIGTSVPIQAKYELLPRGHYTYQVPETAQQAEGNGPKLSMDEYQQVVELYQAQNALQIAQSAGADKYAPDTFQRAQQLLSDAQAAHTRKAGMTTVVTAARHAAQTAEDARIIAMQRKQGDDLAQARDAAARAEAQRAQAEAAAQTARTQAAAAQALLEQERTSRNRTEVQAETPAPPPPPPAPQPQTAVQQSVPGAQQKTEMRMRLYRDLSGVMSSLDTPRGLVVTVPDSDFRDATLAGSAAQRLARIAAIVAAHPGLVVEVDGHERFSEERAYAVRDVLVRDGVPSNAIMARGLGDSRPITSNATAAGREQNRRVEIVIAGTPIGDMPYWARSYKITAEPEQ